MQIAHEQKTISVYGVLTSPSQHRGLVCTDLASKPRRPWYPSTGADPASHLPCAFRLWLFFPYFSIFLFFCSFLCSFLVACSLLVARHPFSLGLAIKKRKKKKDSPYPCFPIVVFRPSIDFTHEANPRVSHPHPHPLRRLVPPHPINHHTRPPDCPFPPS
jgi:hypothetical protein